MPKNDYYQILEIDTLKHTGMNLEASRSPEYWRKIKKTATENAQKIFAKNDRIAELSLDAVRHQSWVHQAMIIFSEKSLAILYEIAMESNDEMSEFLKHTSALNLQLISNHLPQTLLLERDKMQAALETKREKRDEAKEIIRKHYQVERDLVANQDTTEHSSPMQNPDDFPVHPDDIAEDLPYGVKESTPDSVYSEPNPTKTTSRNTGCPSFSSNNKPDLSLNSPSFSSRTHIPLPKKSEFRRFSRATFGRTTSGSSVFGSSVFGSPVFSSGNTSKHSSGSDNASRSSSGFCFNGSELGSFSFNGTSLLNTIISENIFGKKPATNPFGFVNNSNTSESLFSASNVRDTDSTQHPKFIPCDFQNPNHLQDTQRHISESSSAQSIFDKSALNPTSNKNNNAHNTEDSSLQTPTPETHLDHSYSKQTTYGTNFCKPNK